MPTVNLSLGQLFLQAFGYKTDAFDPVVPQIKGDIPSYRTETGKLGGAYYANDLMGREVYMPVEVVVGNDIIPGTSTTYAKKFGVPGGKWQLPYPVISATRTVHIIDTELTERDGMVSELINLSSVKISIKGFLINQANEFPEDDFDTLNRLFALKTVISINCPYTDLLLNDITNGAKTVTIRSLSFPERRGVKHVVPYELELMADVPFNLVDIT